MNVNDAKSLISQYAEFKNLESLGSDRDADAEKKLSCYYEGSSNIPVFKTDEGKYTIYNVENLMSELMNIDIHAVTLNNTDDGYSISYEENGNTYTENMTFIGDSIEISSTNGSKSTIVEDFGDNDLIKYFDAENDGIIDASKSIKISADYREDVSQAKSSASSAKKAAASADSSSNTNTTKSTTSSASSSNTSTSKSAASAAKSEANAVKEFLNIFQNNSE
ncbi:MAG: hypothetical protein LUG16_03865 [Candidatus Gastranaerophilales bacterium]|nr:hypothetical protein [Candidatus Gastranaerophilales bacterium]